MRKIPKGYERNRPCDEGRRLGANIARRSWWSRWRLTVWPIVAATLALYLMFSSNGAAKQDETAAQSASGVMKGGTSFNCFYDLPGLERFCIVNTVERR